ncbi:hypothetical protein J4207_06540 [Candidatus Woesearchaeota archaeon]|nr:hypothetical protein [Candidatus Woesearchaeota archaeon]
MIKIAEQILSKEPTNTLEGKCVTVFINLEIEGRNNFWTCLFGIENEEEALFALHKGKTAETTVHVYDKKKPRCVEQYRLPVANSFVQLSEPNRESSTAFHDKAEKLELLYHEDDSVLIPLSLDEIAALANPNTTPLYLPPRKTRNLSGKMQTGGTTRDRIAKVDGKQFDPEDVIHAHLAKDFERRQSKREALQAAETYIVARMIHDGLLLLGTDYRYTWKEEIALQRKRLTYFLDKEKIKYKIVTPDKF